MKPYCHANKWIIADNLVALPKGITGSPTPIVAREIPLHVWCETKWLPFQGYGNTLPPNAVIRETEQDANDYIQAHRDALLAALPGA